MNLIEKIGQSSFIQPNGKNHPEETWFRIDGFDRDEEVIHYHNEATGNEYEVAFIDLDNAKFYAIVEVK